jgi:hypothetical protein
MNNVNNTPSPTKNITDNSTRFIGRKRELIHNNAKEYDTINFKRTNLFPIFSELSKGAMQATSDQIKLVTSFFNDETLELNGSEITDNNAQEAFFKQFLNKVNENRNKNVDHLLDAALKIVKSMKINSTTSVFAALFQLNCKWQNKILFDTTIEILKSKIETKSENLEEILTKNPAQCRFYEMIKQNIILINMEQSSIVAPLLKYIITKTDWTQGADYTHYQMIQEIIAKSPKENQILLDVAIYFLKSVKIMNGFDCHKPSLSLLSLVNLLSVAIDHPTNINLLNIVANHLGSDPVCKAFTSNDPFYKGTKTILISHMQKNINKILEHQLLLNAVMNLLQKYLCLNISNNEVIEFVNKLEAQSQITIMSNPFNFELTSSNIDIYKLKLNYVMKITQLPPPEVVNLETWVNNGTLSPQDTFITNNLLARSAEINTNKNERKYKFMHLFLSLSTTAEYREVNKVRFANISFINEEYENLILEDFAKLYQLKTNEIYLRLSLISKLVLQHHKDIIYPDTVISISCKSDKTLNINVTNESAKGIYETLMSSETIRYVNAKYVKNMDGLINKFIGDYNIKDTNPSFKCVTEIIKLIEGNPNKDEDISEKIIAEITKLSQDEFKEFVAYVFKISSNSYAGGILGCGEGVHPLLSILVQLIREEKLLIFSETINDLKNISSNFELYINKYKGCGDMIGDELLEHLKI